MTKKEKIEQIEQIDTYLLFTMPGYRWLSSNALKLTDESLKNMNALRLMRKVEKTFRYLHLIDLINGNYATQDVLRQRRERWIKEVEREAENISNETGVKFSKVYPKLLERMLKEIMR